MEFFEAVAESLRRGGLDAEYLVNSANLRIGRLRLYCQHRGARHYVLGGMYRRAEVELAVGNVIRELPRLLSELEARDEERKHVVTVRAAVEALRGAGYYVDNSGRRIEAREAHHSPEDVQSLLRLLVAYHAVKDGKVHYDQAAFIQCILDNPGDTTPILVYADWLDENGHEADAMKLRNMIEEERNAS